MKILSVDLDFLIKDMNVIQKFMDTDLTPKQSWRVISWKSKNKKFELCKDSYDFLNSVILKCLKKETIVESIEEHDKIIEILEKYGVKNSEVINIDYHHDVSYGNDDENLNIENWVLHGRKKGIIKNYNWITQVDAEVCKFSVMNFKSADWRDIDLDKLPKFDIIVFCTSKHFTPPEYWNLNKKLTTFTRYLVKRLNTKICEFDLIDNNFLNELNFSKYPDFFIGNNNKSDYLYKSNGLFIDVYIDEGVPFLSILNLGEANNVFKAKKMVDFQLKTYGKIGFSWKKGIKNEILIKRLLKNYEIIVENENGNIKDVIFKECENGKKGIKSR